MRKIVLTLFLVFSFIISAQEAESVFAPIGAKWHYGIQPSQFAPDKYYSTVEYIKDTIINSKRCAVLERAKYHKPGIKTVNGYTYLHEESQKVYLWDEINRLFILLYDFSLNAGESWVIKTQNCETTMYVDSVKTVIYAERVPLKTLYVSPSALPFSCIESNYFPDITARFCMADFLYWYGYIPGNDMDIPSLRCYYDAEISLKSPHEACDYIYTGTGDVTSPNQPLIFIINKHLYIRNTNLVGINARIYDANGQCMLTTQGNTDNSVDISNLVKGIYFLHFASVDRVQTIKFVIP